MNRTLHTSLGVLLVSLVTSGTGFAQDHAGHGAPADRLGNVTFPSSRR